MVIRTAFFIGVILVFLGAGCSREDTGKVEVAEEPAPSIAGEAGGELPAGHPMVSRPLEDIGPGKHPSGGGAKEVRISEEVKARWKEVKLEVLDKSSNTKELMTLAVGSTVPLKETGFKLRVEVFIPDYAMFEDHIGSRSNELKNAAVLVEMREGDKAVAKGWVFKSFPEFNSYEHERFTIVLLESVSGGSQ
jgi:hypothetical protein